MNKKNNPTPQEVKDIYKYCYLFFTKYEKSNTDKEFKNMVEDAKKIEAKYPYDLCMEMLIKNMDIIHGYYMKKENK